MTPDLVELSRILSYALRHRPQKYGITLNALGWTDLDALLGAIRQKHTALKRVDRAAVEQIIAQSDKRRFELSGDCIRARYGHSLPEPIRHQAVSPPERLYHGTTAQAAASILQQGLRPMNRQYVHLSGDMETAVRVGRRRARNPVILQVRAREAHAHGVAFYLGEDGIWLCAAIPPEYVSTVA